MSPSIGECFICTKHRMREPYLPGGVVHEDGDLLVAHFPIMEEGGTAYRGHMIIEPKRHITRPSELTESEARQIGFLYHRIGGIQEKLLQAEHVYFFRIGDQVPHLHFHVIPRYAGTPKDFRGQKIMEWPDAPRIGSAEIRELSECFRRDFGEPANS